ncbi:MAG: PIN domain-containing protein [Bacteroidales bacterium]|nr:PIN domain-containing protein [Bacteroidales bacterium]
MFDYILDTNILMSILISGKSSYKPIVMFNKFVTVDYIFSEIEEYKETIFSKSKLERSQLVEFTNHILSKIAVLPRYVINENSLKKAVDLTKDIDFNDVWFVALSLEYDLTLLTRDEKLYKGLTNKGFKKIMLFDQFLKNIIQ